ncbi:MAG: thioredoxin family protein [Patescibacteria group bacterium]
MNNSIKSIQVLGSGCPTCKKLHELTVVAAQELNLATEVEYSSDLQKLLDTGLMSSPVLLINGKAVLAGGLPSIEKIKELISASASACGGNC